MKVLSKGNRQESEPRKENVKMVNEAVSESRLTKVLKAVAFINDNLSQFTLEEIRKLNMNSVVSFSQRNDELQRNIRDFLRVAKTILSETPNESKP